MTWNYRVIEFEKDGERWRTIHEVYYDDGKPIMFAEEPAYPMAHENEDMIDAVSRMMEATTMATLIPEQFRDDPLKKS